MSEKMKQCSKCGKIKPLSEFYRDEKNKDGFYGVCKKCCATRSMDYYKKNRERLRKYRQKRYRDKCLGILKRERKQQQLQKTESFRAVAGFNVYILDYYKSGEYKYNVVPTEGEVYKTNDKERFLRYLELHC